MRQPAFNGGHVADAAAELGGHLDAGKDRLDCGGVNRLTCEGAVEIDEVDPFAAGSLERGRLCGGVVREHGGGGHLALQQAHTLAVFQVDGGVEDHGRAPLRFGAYCHRRAGIAKRHATVGNRQIALAGAGAPADDAGSM